ncbi:tRNA (guanine(26)-N(2))-dimethyltransferase [uncultured archaeon]|nr:tRNA (guanine(26)-N(2))-dimethyltransferase [uncultured archaeon]
MDYVSVKEGETDLVVPSSFVPKKRDPVFYNPHMELSRDVGVAVARLTKPVTYCDALSGSGARGIRVAKEAGAKVTLIDLNPVAIELARKNAVENGVEVEAIHDNCNTVLSSRKFDFVDIDPFGPPVRYLDAAMSAVRSQGVLGVAATDTSALCGTYPGACQRKYDATPLRCDCFNEVGLRILLGYVARAALRFSYGMTPLFSHVTRHYMRLYARVDRAGGAVKESRKNVNYFVYRFSDLDRRFVTLNELAEGDFKGYNVAGPLWTGPYSDVDFTLRLADELAQPQYSKGKVASEIARLVSEEQGVAVPYFNLHKLCETKAASPPRMQFVFDELKRRGFLASRTHMEPLGIRTNAPVKEITGLIG